MNVNADWDARQQESPEARRAYERERLIAWTLDAIAENMTQAQLSKADLARALGTSRAHVTQLLSGGRNATLSTVADLAWACGKRALVRFEPLRTGEFISAPVRLVFAKTKVVASAPRDVECSASNDWTYYGNEAKAL